jgi:2-polyprenyl-3-methyl-5-hydroxy-6-metoxy-1,4-benzoquinol methylase
MSSVTSKTYSGNELELFAHAVNWKEYWSKKTGPFIGDRILEIGAGIGTNTKFFLRSNEHIKQWVCLEPDLLLARQIESNIDKTQQSKVSIFTKTLSEFRSEERFDTILYIDVLEHIQEDRAEIELAKEFLTTGGHLVILVPAHNFLYSEFDKSVGHFRRYDKKMMRSVLDGRLKEEQLMYLDAVGMISSMANKVVLKQPYPTLKQIKFWDKVIVKTSQWMDPIFRYRIGKSLLGVWSKNSV